MDETRSKAVYKVFVDLYKKGKIYRKLRMVNWDPKAKTVLSNEEVLYENENSKLYYLKYEIEDAPGSFVTIATTRPETILGDTAVAVHPDDERFNHLNGKRVIVPLVNRSVPVIFDDYVQTEFGTGALKVTPAHDVNDYDIGLRHDLDIIDIFNDDGTLSEAAELFIGQDRFKVRDLIIPQLEEKGHLEKIEDYSNNVGRSERTNAIIEPKLSLQWYVDMKALAKTALDAVMSDEVEFFPKNQKNTYKHWMENIRDWCVSRQLWWGHRIPAYYFNNEVFVAESKEEAMELARQTFPDKPIQIEDLKQDEDVLDTWFSSWLWPISVFDGFENKEELEYYYPTSVLVTGWDIIFLWVARMIMAGYEWQDKRPFDHVFFTGMVRDKRRRKMSKSLGNSPDALKLIEEYGADGVRFGMMTCSNAGNDLLFDEKLCEQGKKFCNKIWNALRLIKGWEVDNLKTSKINTLASSWFESRLNHSISTIDKLYKEYRLSDILMLLYSLIWEDFCSWYLEMIKPRKGEKIDQESKSNAIHFLEKLMQLLHPFMPHITEEIWHQMDGSANHVDIIVSQYPRAGEYNSKIIEDIKEAKSLVSKIREIRNSKGISMKELLPLSVEIDQNKFIDNFGIHWIELIKKIAVLSNFNFVDEDLEGAVAFMSSKKKYFIELQSELNIEDERSELIKKLDYERGFSESVAKKLDNDRFVQNAPETVVARERKKLEDSKERIRILEENIARLN